MDPITAESRFWRYLPLAIVGIAVAMMVAAILVTGPRSSLIERITAMPIAPGPPIISLDVVQATPGAAQVIAQQGKTIVSVTPTQSITLVGWAFDGTVNKPGRSMYIEVDGRTIEPVQYGMSRPDVGAHFGNPALAASGFEVVIRPNRFGPGVHQVDLILVDASGASYHRVSDRVEIHEAT